MSYLYRYPAPNARHQPGILPVSLNQHCVAVKYNHAPTMTAPPIISGMRMGVELGSPSATGCAYIGDAYESIGSADIDASESADYLRMAAR